MTRVPKRLGVLRCTRRPKISCIRSGRPRSRFSRITCSKNSRPRKGRVKIGSISLLGRILDNGQQPNWQGDSPMRRTRAELRADLTQVADEVIDELLNWTEDAD